MHARIEPFTTGAFETTVHPTIEETFEAGICAQNVAAAIEDGNDLFASASTVGEMPISTTTNQAQARKAETKLRRPEILPLELRNLVFEPLVGRSVVI